MQQTSQFMILFKRAADVRNYLETQGEIGAKIGFIPTMGGPS